MNRVTPTHFGLFTGALALGVLLSSHVGAQEGGSRQALRLAFVDIGELFDRYGVKAELEQEINLERKVMKEQIQQEQQRILAMRRELDQVVPGSDTYERGVMAVKKAQYSLELEQKRLEGILKKQVEQNTLRILDDLLRTVERYGKREGYTAIFKVDRGRGAATSGDLASLQEGIFRAQIADVLYHDAEQVGITDQVLELLNSPENKAWLEKTRSKKRE